MFDAPRPELIKDAARAIELKAQTGIRQPASSLKKTIISIARSHIFRPVT